MPRNRGCFLRRGMMTAAWGFKSFLRRGGEGGDRIGYRSRHDWRRGRAASGFPFPPSLSLSHAGASRPPPAPRYTAPEHPRHGLLLWVSGRSGERSRRSGGGRGSDGRRGRGRGTNRSAVARRLTHVAVDGDEDGKGKEEGSLSRGEGEVFGPMGLWATEPNEQFPDGNQVQSTFLKYLI